MIVLKIPKFSTMVLSLGVWLCLFATANASTVSFYIYDSPGKSVQSIVNTSQAPVNTYEYDSFGNIKGETVTVANEYTFDGERTDPNTGLIYLRNRNYDPFIGRFVTKDIHLGSTQMPASINPYIFVKNNPVEYIDPKGTGPEMLIAAAILLGYAALPTIEADGTMLMTYLGESAPAALARAASAVSSVLPQISQIATSAINTAGVASIAVGTITYAVSHLNVNTAINTAVTTFDFAFGAGVLSPALVTAGATAQQATVFSSALAGNAEASSQGEDPVVGTILGILGSTMDNAGVNSFIGNATTALLDPSTCSNGNSNANSQTSARTSVPDSFGGVDLNLTATLLGNVRDFGGATYDQATGQIILYGQQNVSLPAMDLDDLSVAVDSEYGLNGVAPADPGVSIGTVASTVAGQMYVGYFGAVMNTEFGEVLFNSDRLLKSLTLGQDNITGEPVSVNVPGYIDMLNRYKAGGSAGAADIQANPTDRMWFTPKQITLAESADGSSMEFSQATMELLTSSQLNGIVETDPYALAFAAEVTNDYDAYAAQYPILQQLTRLGKITSVVKWIQANNIPFDLSFFSNYVPQSVPTACPGSEPAGCTSSQVCTAYACTPQYTPQTSVSTTFGVSGGIDTITITGGVIYTLDASNFTTSTDTTTTSPSTSAGQAAVNARPSETNFSWNFNVEKTMPIVMGFHELSCVSP